mgnify:CR=1 FL=1
MADLRALIDRISAHATVLPSAPGRVVVLVDLPASLADRIARLGVALEDFEPCGEFDDDDCAEREIVEIGPHGMAEVKRIRGGR